MSEEAGEARASRLRPLTRRRLLGAAGLATGAVVAETVGRVPGASAAPRPDTAWTPPYAGYLLSASVSVPAGGPTVTVTIDLSVADHWDITLGNNAQLVLANPPPAATPTWIFVRTHQDAVGSWTLTFFPGTVWPIGVVPVLSVEPGAQDSFSFLALNGVTTGYIAGQDES